MMLDGRIVCLPLYNRYGKDLDYGLVLHDFVPVDADGNITEHATVWHHASCTIDRDYRLIRGTLYRHDYTKHEMGYLHHDAGFVADFDLTQGVGDTLSARINAASAGPGAREIFYADVRVWSTARTLDEIKSNRF